jgi:S-adenosylmethionine:tRNA ribosyltransferase-isomerase
MSAPTAKSAASPAELTVYDFDFHLPEELIAQQPPAQRGASRMMVVNRSIARSLPIADMSFADRHFADLEFVDLPSLLNPGDVLVLNDSRVIPARLFARRANARGKQEPSGQIEVLLTHPEAEGNWQALVRPGRKVRLGDQLAFYAEEPEGAEGTEEGEGSGAFRPLNQPQAQRGSSPGTPLLEAEVLASGDFGARTLRFEPVSDFFAILDRIGHMPLPPYIKRDDATADRDRYQTVFAAQRGSVAAPTAGLHFTPAILDAIQSRGVQIAKVTLHVGLGTFAPLRVQHLSQIHLHTERYTLPAETAAILNRARAEARRIVAVGTTVVRTLEHCAQLAASTGSELTPHTGETSIFIAPGHHFRIVNAMLTNFHLPQSSLLMLVSAFAGLEDGRARILAAYNHAVSERYRFFSYGDCMFIS